MTHAPVAGGPATALEGRARLVGPLGRVRAGDWTALVNSPGYTFAGSTFTVSAADTLAVLGYDISAPAATADSNYVTAYIDLGSGVIDSATGLMIPAEDVEMTLTLIGNPRLTDGTWLIIPTVQQKRPDANGRVQFTIPATSVMTPSGAYYKLTYKKRGGLSYLSGLARQFYVDTTPDPLNILDATEARR